jgi:diketogulonate reductase-like aldo/keto reductase
MSKTIKIVSGKEMPTVGLGTWKSKGGVVGGAVKAAVAAGYTHIDCASNYLNEDEVGDALSEIFAEGKVKREDLFITSKLNNPYHHKEHVRPHLEKTLKDLNLEYLDLWLMHWPVAFVYTPYDPNRRGFDASYDPDGLKNVDLSANGGSKIDMTVSIRETWEAMQECVDAGLVKNIGVSNFGAGLIHDMLTYARIKPAVNQVEMHPYCAQPALVAFCARHGITITAYSPLGTGDFKGPNDPTLLEDKTLIDIAARHSKSVAQVCIRWAVQRGTVVIPKSVTPSRIAENISVYDFTLTDDDMAAINALDRNFHFLRPNDWYQIPLFTA